MLADNSKIYNTREVVEILGFSRRHLYDLIYRGEIQYVKVGRDYRFKGGWINEFINTYMKGEQVERD